MCTEVSTVFRTINERNGGAQGLKIDNRITLEDKGKPEASAPSQEEKSKEDEKEVVMQVNEVIELVEKFVLQNQQLPQAKGAGD